MKKVTGFQREARSCTNEHNPFNVYTIDPAITQKHWDHYKVLNNHFVIIWVTYGNGNYWPDYYNCNFRNNCLLFIRPEQFSAIQIKNVLQGYIFSFSLNFLGTENQDSESLLRCMHQMFSTKSISLHNKCIVEMEDITYRIVEEFKNANLFRTEILRRYFKIFLIHLSRQLQDILLVKRHSRNMDILQNFVSLLEQNFRNEKMVADYAHHLAVSPNYLNEVIKRVTGQPAGHHIRQRIALEAKRKAAYSDTCMKEVAYELGFLDLSHFSRFFKNATGMNFSEFRKNGLDSLTVSSLPN